MNRIAKLLCFVAMLALTFVLAVAEAPRAEAHPNCTPQGIEDCNNYCAQFGCLGTCVQRCMCAC